MSCRAVDQLRRFRERNPSITGLVSIIGLPTTKVLVSATHAILTRLDRPGRPLVEALPDPVPVGPEDRNL